MYPDSGYKTTHAQSVCTRPFSRGEGPGDEATAVAAVAASVEGRVLGVAAVGLAVDG